jgi:hypothetical protein
LAGFDGALRPHFLGTDDISPSPYFLRKSTGPRYNSIASPRLSILLL